MKERESSERGHHHHHHHRVSRIISEQHSWRSKTSATKAERHLIKVVLPHRFVVSSRFWNVVVVSKVLSRDARTTHNTKRRRQKRRLSFERGEKKKMPKRKDDAKSETARARRDATRPRRLRRRKKNERRFPRAKILTTPRTTSSFVIRFDAIF